MNEDKIDIKGLFFAFFGYFIWGLLPIYWKQIKICSPLEILSSRIVWSFFLMIVYIFFTNKELTLKYFHDKKIRTGLFATALIVSINWLVYIFAVNNNEIIQASMGYYINPFVNIFFGVIFFKEKINSIQWMAISFAFIGVVYMVFSYGSFPWISLTLAFSFSLYGLLKKIYQFNSIVSLFLEMALIFPVAIGYQIYLTLNNSNHLFDGDISFVFLIIMTGVATVVPLLLFTEGAKRIPYSTIGILQFFAPTMMFLIGVFVYGEIFNIANKISFSFIWTGVLIYIYALAKNIIKTMHS